ncbi:MAG: hypothetical protein JXA49_06350 [Actinobacteria bacterium]|nr:hypothetical protein [Actinomycetota bacterium]
MQKTTARVSIISPAGKNKFRLVFILAVFIVLSMSMSLSPPRAAARGVPGTAVDENPGGKGKAVLFVIDRIGIDDLSETDAPNIFKLISTGGFALMNARLVRDFYGNGSYLVIGAGGRANAGSNAGLAFNYDELLTGPRGEQIKAGNIYSSRTGRKAPEGSVVNLYIEEMIRNSDNFYSTSEPGLLGQTLKSKGKVTALLGNADSLAPARSVDTTLSRDQEYSDDLIPSPEEIEAYPSVVAIHREASCIAMDKNGIVPIGNVSANLSGVNPEHTNVTTNYERIISETEMLLPRTDLVVIDLGQTSRVDEGSSYYTDKALAEARSAAIKNSDQAVGEILKSLDLSKDMVIICTPTPSREMLARGELLTPLVISGPGFKTGTLLASPTTRRTGVVSNFDIAPTLLEYFGIDTPGKMEGRPLSETSTSTDIGDMKKFRTTVVASSTTRKSMVRFYVISVMVLISLFIMCVFLRDDLVYNHGLFWKTALLMVLCGPFAYLIYPVFGNAALYRSIPLVIGICLLTSLAAVSLGGTRPFKDTAGHGMFVSMIFVSCATLFTALIDPLLGSPLMTLSAFGSDIIIAGRYYGIGNLYMGVIVGSSVLFACLVCEVFQNTLDKSWKRYLFTCTVFILMGLFLSYPRIGANVGGLITAVAASAATLLKLEGRPLNWKKILAAGIIVLLCVAVLIVVTSILPEQASHAGRAISRFREAGISSVLPQAMRKLSANWSLAFVSTWRLLLLLAVFGALLLNWKFKLFRKLRRGYRYLTAGMAGMTAGLVAALLFNDSGIEPAAAISIYLFVPLLLLVIQRIRDSASTGGKPDRFPADNIE